MVTLELNNEVSTVRIHDDYFDSKPEKLLASAGLVVTDSYKRRLLDKNSEYSKSSLIKTTM